MPVLKIPEKISNEAAEFILSLDERKRVQMLWTDNDNNTNKGEKWDTKEVYIKQVLTYLKLQLENACFLNVEYNYSSKMRNNGRVYAKMGLQGCKKNLRGFLCRHFYIDYDMENCHVKILRHILLKYVFKNDVAKFKKTFSLIYHYSLNQETRQDILTQAECGKTDILNMMNNPNNWEEDNHIAQKIDDEFKEVQNLFWFNCPDELMGKYSNFKNPNVKNKKGSWLNRLLTIFENEIIQKVYKYYQEKYPDENRCSSLIFDGVHISHNIGNQVPVLNEITKQYGCTWAKKDFDNSIEDSEEWLSRNDLPPYESFEYTFIRDKFQENHFMIENPLTFVKERTIKNKKHVTTYNQTDFKTIIKPIKYEKRTKTGFEKVGIFDKWLDDPERKSYFKLDFIPVIGQEDKTTFNTFQGFDYHNYENRDFTYTDRLINIFRKQTLILSNYDVEAAEWIIKFFADLLQNPTRLPAVALVLKSGQGYGKDTLIDTISKLLGQEYMCRTANPEEIFGQFNSGLKNKIFLQLNELEGKDGFANKEKFKNLITENTTQINEKNMKRYTQSNFLRIIVASNNSTPIEIPIDDRRFVVCKAALEKPSQEYFNTFHECLEDDDCLFSLYKYLMEYDLKDIKPKDCRPITIAYEDVKENATHPFYYWLYDALDNFTDEFQDHEYKTNKRNGDVLVMGDILFQHYREHMTTTEQDMRNFTQRRTMKDMLSRFNIHNKKYQENGSRVRYYSFNVKVILKYLEKQGFDDDGEVLNEDDYY